MCTDHVILSSSKVDSNTLAPPPPQKNINVYRLGPNFMDLLTVNKEFGTCRSREFCVYVKRVSQVTSEFGAYSVFTRHSTLTQLAQKFGIWK